MRAVGIRLMAVATLLCLALAGSPATAGGTFTVSGVQVEATATSASEARKAALAAGRAKAWVVLFRRLVRESDWDKRPVLTPVQLQRLISSYYPESEKRSTTRYSAKLTYNFNPGAVSRILRSAGLAYASGAAETVLLIPFSQGYAGSSDWGVALADPRFKDSFIPFRLPSGDAADLAVLGPLDFHTAQWADLAPLAARYQVHEIVLVQALPDPDGHLRVTLRRLSAEVPAAEMNAPAAPAAPVAGDEGAADPYAAAADSAVSALEMLWKQQSVIDFATQSTLTANVKMSSLQDFAALRVALSRVPGVASVAMDAMDMGAARLTLTYMGTPEQLRAHLSQAGITLSGTDGAWSLARSTEEP